MQRELQADVIIIGGGLGGVAAAIGACRMGQRVILTEESDWLGGQLTAQGVPPDEHPWIETTGCTQTYQRLRVLIMDYYRRNYPLRPEVRQQVHLNPGLSHVSRLTCEPRAALAAINELLAPYRAAG
ncbi:MAG TPA: FAD-dependent oxidoreductase, partial [Aggregatilineales bacterium]|nr:FAD-dependent oxidoreductase [Aggregatilineales bacterium]